MKDSKISNNDKESESYIGIDVSKEKLDICLLLLNKDNGQEVHQKVIGNNEVGYKRLLVDINKHNLQQSNLHICMETTGKYHMGVAEYLYSKGYKVSVVNPCKISAYKTTRLIRNKTDSYDAKVIAEYCKMYSPKEWHADSKEKKELKSLYRLLDSYKKELIRHNNQKDDMLTNKEIDAVKNETIQHMKDQIKKVEELIKKFIQSNESIKNQYELLQTIPAIGSITAIGLLAELPELDNFKTARELAAHVGITPKHNISGKGIYKQSRISKIGSVILRNMLYFPSITATRYNQRLKEFFIKLTSKGKKKMIGIIAVMRKMVHIIYGVLKSGEEYKEGIVIRQKAIA